MTDKTTLNKAMKVRVKRADGSFEYVTMDALKQMKKSPLTRKRDTATSSSQKRTSRRSKQKSRKKNQNAPQKRTTREAPINTAPQQPKPTPRKTTQATHSATSTVNTKYTFKIRRKKMGEEGLTLSQQPRKVPAPVPRLSRKQALSTTTPVKDVFIDEAKAKSVQPPTTHKPQLPRTPRPGELVSTTMTKSILPQRIQHKRKNDLRLKDEKSQAIKDSPRSVRAQDTPSNSKKQKIFDSLASGKQSAPVVKLNIPDTTPAPHLTPKPELKIMADEPRQWVPERPEMKDVQAAAAVEQLSRRSVGPVDELETFTLEHLYRLSPDPKIATEKLVEKFMLLRKESYLTYQQAIEGWHRSPLFRQYTGVVEASLKQGKHIRQIISEQTSQAMRGPQFTEQTFFAIAGLNRQLV